jgi:hypothetical protein
MKHTQHRRRDPASAIAAAVLQVVDTAPEQAELQQLETYLRDEIADLKRQIAAQREVPDA